MIPGALAKATGWPGVDEHVVRPFAEAAGRPPTSLIPMPEGDLLLFAFLCAGIVGGWFLGYYYRVLFVEAPGGAKVPGGPEHRLVRGPPAPVEACGPHFSAESTQAPVRTQKALQDG